MKTTTQTVLAHGDSLDLTFGRWTVRIVADCDHVTAVKYVTGSDIAVRSADFVTLNSARVWAAKVCS